MCVIIMSRITNSEIHLMRGEQISKVINMSDDINKIAVELFPKCTI